MKRKTVDEVCNQPEGTFKKFIAKQEAIEAIESLRQGFEVPNDCGKSKNNLLFMTSKNRDILIDFNEPLLCFLHDFANKGYNLSQFKSLDDLIKYLTKNPA